MSPGEFSVCSTSGGSPGPALLEGAQFCIYLDLEPRSGVIFISFFVHLALLAAGQRQPPTLP